MDHDSWTLVIREVVCMMDHDSWTLVIREVIT